MNSEILQQIDIREAEESDHAFIFSTWLRCYKHESAFAKPIAPKVFFARHHKVVERILAYKETRILVCSPKDDDHTILGYLVYTDAKPKPVVQFCYVKMPFRKLGVAKALWNEALIVPEYSLYTHRMDDMKWAEQRWPLMEYDPYLI